MGSSRTSIERTPRIQQLRAIFQRHAGRQTGPNFSLPTDLVQRAAWDLSVYPSKSQIWELFVCLGNRGECQGLRFHEFCILVTFLQNLRRTHSAPQKKAERIRKVEDARWDVFLGGACNPTTWRFDDAIPFCKKNQIAFYNPQVAEWSPHLVAVENFAKECSLVNLFVLDLKTRGVASMVELGFLSGANYNLLAVLPKQVPERLQINGDEVSKEEADCLRRAILFLSDLLERRGYPLFHDLRAALSCVKKLARDGRTVLELSESDGAVPVHDSEFDVGLLGALLLKTFQSYAVEGSDKVSISDAESILRVMLGRIPALQKAFPGASFTFPDLCLLYAIQANPDRSSVACSGNWLARLFSPLSRLAAWLLQPACPPYRPPVGPRRHYDVFLGGTCGDTTWRERDVIPKLLANGVSFFDPQDAMWSTRLLPVEAKARDLCRVLLFVITGETLSAACLVEAAHFIGQRRQVVLYVEALNELSAAGDVNGVPLSPTGLKDYNRGRTYLLDYANRQNVPVAHTIEDAVDRVLTLVGRSEANINV